MKLVDYKDEQKEIGECLAVMNADGSITLKCILNKSGESISLGNYIKRSNNTYIPFYSHNSDLLDDMHASEIIAAASTK